MAQGQERVVALADMDCFFMQVEQRLEPRLRGRPCAVVQYNRWRGGGVIAVSYEARAFGVARGMWAADARKLCPDLLVARVPQARGKADLTRYREASLEVMEVMSRFAVIERASIDEAYMDLTNAVQERLRKMRGQPVPAELLPTTFIQGLPDDTDAAAAQGGSTDCKEELRQHGLHQWLSSLPFDDSSCPDLQLTVGAVIVEEMRAAVEEVTGYRCSAGISHNKVLAKLACGLHKPNRQTLIPLGRVPQLFSQMPINSIRNLGGKLGASVSEILGVEYMGQLTQFSMLQLQTHFGNKTGSWLYDMCRGIEHEPVRPRYLPQSIGCSKNFPGKTALATQQQVQHWILQLASELESRLGKDRSQNGRIAKQLMVSIRMQGDLKPHGLTRCCALARYDAHKISTDAFALIRNCNMAGAQQAAWSPPLTMLLMSASKFSEAPTLLPAGIATFLTSEAPTAGATAPISPNAKSLGSPRKEPGKKPVNAIDSYFQRAAEKQQACAAAGPCVPVVIGAGSLLPCPDRHQDLEDPILNTVQSPEAIVKQSPKGGNSPSSKPLPCEESSGTAGTSSAALVPRTTLKAEPEAASEQAAEWKEGSLAPSSGCGQAPHTSPGDQLLCEKCGQQVLVWDLPEHMDYHFAVELQNSFTELSFPHTSPVRTSPCAMPTSPCAMPLSPANGKSKPKTPTGSSMKRRRQGVTRTLDYFFKRLPP
ncbi:DNA polymerase eta [Alligator mississippiensis]|uniref:DNA polymerase eta n=3 Tax=Alligator mississippiensis TaxID=8496 RepID=A0A151MHG1_ALLMI|nr:DNA polymerase eta [Alligator mississippiensis]